MPQEKNLRRTPSLEEPALALPTTLPDCCPQSLLTKTLGLFFLVHLNAQGAIIAFQPEEHPLSALVVTNLCFNLLENIFTSPSCFEIYACCI
jgi:hypothetical protein